MESWFVKIPDRLKFKCFQELATVKYSPALNLKSSEQVANDIEKVKKQAGSKRS